MCNDNAKRKIIVAALDWGLGHASRMIPLIEYLVDANYNVAFASSGSALTLLRNRFPSLVYFELPAYNIVYDGKSMVWQMIKLLPNLIEVRKRENKMLNDILKSFKADLIISDNRYGFYHKNIPSVFITHQLQILAPKAISFINPWLRKLHFRLMSEFEQIWVPDFNSKNSLAGKLSNIENPPSKIKYIGPLSRFDNVNFLLQNKDIQVKSIVVLLSGPEPSRTNFEKILIAQLENFQGRIVLLRGLPNCTENIVVNGIEVHNHLDDDRLLQILETADLVISRSGYSSIMDMYALKKSCVFVPTPRQTEQEYLANRLMSNKIIYCQTESDFNLDIAINSINEYSGFDNIEGDKVKIDDVIQYFNL